MKTLVALCLVATALLAGCGSSRSVLYSGISPPLGGNKVVVTDAAAVRDARGFRVRWLALVHRADRHGGETRLSQQEFRQRLTAAAARYGFAVKEVQFVHAGRAAPLVVVQTSRYVALSHAVPAIARSLDPHRGRNDGTGWSFRAFFLEALDERGVPFLAVSNDPGGGGGQWARSDPLFPFLHG